MVVVQVVEILWTKTTRGAPGSTIRAALPRQYAIQLSDSPYVVNHVRLEERQDFRPVTFRHEALPSMPQREGCLCLHEDEPGHLQLGLDGTVSAGKPSRYPVKQAVTLMPDQWAKLLINARHSTYSGQWYSELVYNVTMGSSVPADRFTRGRPDHEFSLATLLF